MTGLYDRMLCQSVSLRRYCLGAGLALVEMKVLLALLARKYSLTCDNNTEWVQSMGRVPKVSVMRWCLDQLTSSYDSPLIAALRQH